MSEQSPQVVKTIMDRYKLALAATELADKYLSYGVHKWAVSVGVNDVGIVLYVNRRNKTNRELEASGFGGFPVIVKVSGKVRPGA